MFKLRRIIKIKSKLTKLKVSCRTNAITNLITWIRTGRQITRKRIIVVSKASYGGGARSIYHSASQSNDYLKANICCGKLGYESLCHFIVRTLSDFDVIALEHLSNRGAMMVYPHHNFGIRPRKESINNFRKQNYWSTDSSQEPTPWYVWEKRTLPRSRSEERPSKQGCDTAGVRKDLREYLMTSTLHGLRYVGEKKLTWFERFFWLGAFSFSIVCAGFFILNVYAKWRSSPMIVSINPENMALQNLPFPAITVCNVNQAKKSVAERYKKNGDPVDKKLLESLCTSQEDTEIFESNVALSADWDYFRSFLINVTQPCSEMLAMCIWDSGEMNCQDLFNAQLTDEGLCCTFNVVHRNKMFRNPKDLNDMNLTFPLPSVDWTPEGGYPPDAPYNGFPWRPRGVGTDHGLTLVLDANLAEYYCATTKSPSFKILLHNPTETPKIANLGDIYGPGIEARVVIQPRISDAALTLKSIDIKKRVCLFSSEKTLVFYRTYTLKNCEMECEARNMLAICKCVLYYMPKNKTTRVCGKADAKCYSNIKLTPKGRQSTCDECLPACTEIAYYERMSAAKLSKVLVEQYVKRLGNRTPEYVTKNMLIIHFYFEERTFTRFTKGEIFGLTEFLSNTGGLLGLCMGFSMMSVVELLYFLTLRALCLARRRRPKHHFTQ